MINIFNIVLVVFIILSPVFFLPLSVPSIATLQFHQFGFFGNSIDLFQLQFFCFSVSLLFGLSMFSKEINIYQNKLISLLLILCLVNVYFHPKTIKIFPIILLGFILYHLVSTYTNIKNLRLIFYSIAFVSVINTIISIFQFFGIYLIISKKVEIFGLMGYKTQLGIYQALAIPICYVLNPWLSIVPAIGLLLSKSGTAFIPAIIGMCYLLRKKLIRIQSPPIWLCFFTLIALFIYKHSHQLFLRFTAWVEAVRGGMNHLLIGNGIGIFNHSTEIGPYNVAYTDPYSLYLQIFHALGIFGVFLSILFILRSFINIPRGTLNQGLVASCLVLSVSGIGYSFLDYPRLAGTAIVLFGLLTIVKRTGYEN